MTRNATSVVEQRAATRAWIARHRALVGAAIVVLVIVVALLVRFERRAGSVAGPTEKSTSGTPDMAGMQGMSADGAVHLTASQLTKFGVTYGTVEPRMLTGEVRTVGTVVTDESRTAIVTPKFNGYVERLYVNTTGQPVRRGEPLAAIYSPELLAAEEELLLARQLDRTVGQSAVPGVPSSSGELLAAAKRRLRLWDVSEAQIAEVLRTGKPLRTITLYSPASGVVTEKNVTLGQAVQAGMPLYSVADLSDVWVDVQLRESEAGQVRVGSTADLEFATYPGRSYKGRVSFIYPTIAEQTRTVRARVTVSNSDRALKPGMYATVHLSSPTRTALTVPRTAVVQTGERALVFVDMGGGALKPVNVTVGRAVGDYVEVLSGLAPGQRVVTSAQFLLDSESNLAEVMKSMIGMDGGRNNAAVANDSDMKGMELKGADTRGMPGAAASPRAPR